MTTIPTACPVCGAPATGNFCSGCGAGLAPRACAHCQAQLSPGARFCHRCGQPAPGAAPAPPAALGRDRVAWPVAGVLCVLLVGAIILKVTRGAPEPVAPDMANAGASSGQASGAAVAAGAAPDISRMSPRERFDRLFNRIMQAAEQGDSAQVARFTPMALGAYAQLDSVDIDARYHAAVLRIQSGDPAGAVALADTIQAESPGHLFGYLIRGTAAEARGDAAARARAARGFLANYDAEMKANRPEYLEHRPALEEFKRQADSR
ncbi:MAG: zinc ribbon domain-containing protein [Gemmatimonadales bacterium]